MRAATVSRAFGKILRQQRLANGLTQERLALEASVDRSFVSQIERGEHQPSLTTLFKLGEVLGVLPSALILRMERDLKVSGE